MTNQISNSDDTIDSRDVIERIEELESDLEDAEEGDMGDEREELAALKALAEEAAPYSPDWQYGSQLIRESYFEQAMDELVSDCYEIPKDLPDFMTITLDYDMLKQDYTEVDFDGVTYYIR